MRAFVMFTALCKFKFIFRFYSSVINYSMGLVLLIEFDIFMSLLEEYGTIVLKAIHSLLVL